MHNLIPHSRPTLNRDEARSIEKVLRNGYISQGNFVSEFEKRFARYLKVKAAVAVNSGTSALHLCLLALGIKPKDEVILSTYVCSAVLNAILYLGAQPKFADINRDDLNISFRDTKRKLSSRTKSIILTHMFGSPIDTLPFKDLGIPLIEDCAQAIGAEYQGKKVGASGDLAMASFYATKLITTGEGGMVFSNNLKLIEKIRDLREYDKRTSFKLRFNYKMTDIQAAMGLIQLRKLDNFITRRRYLAARYYRAFHNCDFGMPKHCKQHVYFRYIIRVDRNINQRLNCLVKNKVICERPVGQLLHEYYSGSGRFPEAEAAWNSNISIPIYPSLKSREQKRVIEVVKEIC